MKTLALRLSPWLQYQKERFPLLQYAPLVAAFSASGLALSYMLTGLETLPNLKMFTAAFSVTLMVFMQLRISDEIKDAHFDRVHHPERPIPRGLIELDSLKNLGFVLALCQILIVLKTGPVLMLPLLAIWAYLFLMHNEFFVGEWLNKHPVLYMLSHMGILFFTDLFITACHWMVLNIEPGHALLFFFGTSFKLGMIIEIGRKIKSPEEEIEGANTYTNCWGIKNAVLIWLTTIFSSLIMATITAAQVGFGFQTAFVGSIMFAICLAAGLSFISSGSKKWSKAIESISGLWTLTLYLLVGVVPFALKLIV